MEMTSGAEAEIAVDAEQNFQLFRGQDAAQPTLRLAHHAREFRSCVVFARDVLFGVVRRLRRGEEALRLLLPEAHLL